LTDDDVKNLSEALKNNTVFKGELNLSKNNLSDLSGLYVANAMKTFKGIQKLDLSKNNLRSKAGEYIGDVLIENPNYKLHELNFKGNKLEEYGLRRVIVGVTMNHNVTKIKLGVISDFGLELLSNELENTNLKNIAFEEDEDHPFTDRVKDLFIEKLEEIKLERVSHTLYISIIFSSYF
jgi:hypothetical protein